MDVAEANLGAMMSAYVTRKFKITILPNDAALTKSKFKNLFSHVVLGLNSPSSLSTSIMNNTTDFIRNQARLTIEAPEYLYFLKTEDKAQYKKALKDKTVENGWKLTENQNDFNLESKLYFFR